MVPGVHRDPPYNRSKLAWLRFREQGFYFLLVVPVIAMLLVFFVVPLWTMLMRSFQADPHGVLVENEIATVTSNAATQIRVQHSKLMDLDGDGQRGPSDVKVKLLRDIRASTVEPATGTVILAEEVKGG